MSKTFYEVFSSNMKAMGLPVPETLFGALGTTLGTIGAIAGAVAKVGTSVTVSELLLTIPLGAEATVVAAAVGEIVAVAGAVVASFYVGACIGSVLVAAYETLAAPALVKVASWAADLADKLGSTVSQFIANAIQRHPELSPVRKSVVLSKLTQTAPTFTTANTVLSAIA